MGAQEVFRWAQIGAHATVSLFIHPYGDREFASFSIVPNLASNVPSGAVQVKARLTVDMTHRHVDGVAYTLSVENTSVGPQPFIAVRLLEFAQTF